MSEVQKITLGNVVNRCREAVLNGDKKQYLEMARRVELVIIDLINKGDIEGALGLQLFYYQNIVKLSEEESIYRMLMVEHTGALADKVSQRPFITMGADLKKLVFVHVGGNVLGHTEVMLGVLEKQLKNHPNEFREIYIATFSKIDDKFKNRLDRLSVTTIELADELPLVQRIEQLSIRVSSLNIGVAVWVSVPVIVSAIFPRRLSALQIMWSLKFHSVHLGGHAEHIGLPKIGSGDFDPELCDLMIKNRRLWVGFRAPLDAPINQLEDEKQQWKREFADKVIFGTLARDEKYIDKSFRQCVYRILDAVPNSVYIYTNNGQYDPFSDVPLRLQGRMIKSPWVDTSRRSGDLDVFLDTFPFGCGVTGVQALKQGTPVVSMWARNTLPHFYSSSRTIASTALPHWAVAGTEEEYVNAAVSLGSKKFGHSNGMSTAAKAFFEDDATSGASRFFEILGRLTLRVKDGAGAMTSFAADTAEVNQIVAVDRHLFSQCSDATRIAEYLGLCRENSISIWKLAILLSEWTASADRLGDLICSIAELGFYEVLAAFPEILEKRGTELAEHTKSRLTRLYVNHYDDNLVAQTLLASRIREAPLTTARARQGAILIVADKISEQYVSYATSYLGWLKELAAIQTDIYFFSDSTTGDRTPSWVSSERFFNTASCLDEDVRDKIKHLDVGIVVVFSTRRRIYKDYILQIPVISFDNVLEFDSGYTYTVFNKEMLYGWQAEYSKAKKIIFEKHWCWTLPPMTVEMPPENIFNVFRADRSYILSFNRPLKYSDRFINALSSISNRCETKVVFNYIQSDVKELRDNLVSRLLASGANLDSFIFLPRLSPAQVRWIYTVRSASFLDSFPCSGGITTFESAYFGHISPIFCDNSGRPNTSREIYGFLGIEPEPLHDESALIEWASSLARRREATPAGSAAAWQMLFDHRGFAESFNAALDLIQRADRYFDVRIL